MRTALIVRGGWDGHHPVATSDIFVPFLKANGFQVITSEDRDTYLDERLMARVHLIMHNWTAFMPAEKPWANAFCAAVERGAGLAGFHGGMCDAFRGDAQWYLCTGGQFVGHPNQGAPYRVTFTDRASPLTAGLEDFTINDTEQYYMVVDPGSHMLATTVFDGVLHEVGCQPGAVMPVAWTRTWGKGKVFYQSIGHSPKDFEVSQVRILTERGLLWAAAEARAQGAA